MKLESTIWPVLAIVAGGLLLKKRKQNTDGVGRAPWEPYPVLLYAHHKPNLAQVLDDIDRMEEAREDYEELMCEKYDGRHLVRMTNEEHQRWGALLEKLCEAYSMRNTLQGVPYYTWEWLKSAYHYNWL